MPANVMLSIFNSATGQYVPFTGKSAPSSYAVIPQDMANMERSVQGVMSGDFINSVDEIQLTFNAMLAGDYQMFIALTKMQFFKVQYWCDYENRYKNDTFYKGNDLKVTPLDQWQDPGFKRFKVSVTLIGKGGGVIN